MVACTATKNGDKKVKVEGKSSREREVSRPREVGVTGECVGQLVMRLTERRSKGDNHNVM